MSIEDRARYAEALQLIARHGMVSITREQYTAIEPFLEHPSWTLDGKWLTREQVLQAINAAWDGEELDVKVVFKELFGKDDK